ncbi:MAG: HDIG domain-containing protein [Oscillospiraceae bacterium]|jgi:putative nucleotidyltransferase with HDIG domain|nr:HDIG domain-containing protein [Oscillospiraceae bacterium]
MEGKDGAKQRLKRLLTGNAVLCALIGALAYIAVTAVVALSSSPKQFDLRAGDIAPQTIAATKDILDEATTNANKERVAAGVSVSYMEASGAREESLARLDTIFSQMEDARAFGEALKYGTGSFSRTYLPPPSDVSGEGELPTDLTDMPDQAATDEQARTDETPIPPTPSPTARPAVTRIPDGEIQRAQYEAAAKFIPDLTLSTWQMTILLGMPPQDLIDTRDETRRVLSDAMDSMIVEGQTDSAITGIQRQLIVNMPLDVCYNIAMPAVRACIQPNMILNIAEIEQRREEARAAVEPVYIKQGQNIVIAGNRVTAEQIKLLNDLGLLSGKPFDRMLLGGVCLMVGLTMMVFILYLRLFERKIASQPHQLLLLTTLALITIAATLGLQAISPNLAPLAMGALLATALISPQIGFAFNVFLCVLLGCLPRGAGSYAQQMLRVITQGMLGGTLGIFVMAGHSKRITMLFAGAYVALFNMVSMFALGFITNSSMSSILNEALFACGGGLLAALAALGLQPALEWVFNVVTPAKLIELANPNQPLLQRIMMETPGTYHHSLMVANIGESAADAIGANGLLVRVGAYYHDAGKLLHPQYFKENQLAENPHDTMEPYTSAQLIISHVSEGVALAQQYRLPKQVTDLIAQHHGDTPVLYFYNKARERDGDAVNISLFRYNHPRPQTKEAALLMLADSVEAAVRATPQPSAKKIEQTIQAVVRQKVQDGQLDETPLRFKDVTAVSKVFCEVLAGLYHQRVEYPALDSGRQPLSALPPTQDAPPLSANPSPNQAARPSPQPESRS